MKIYHLHGSRSYSEWISGQRHPCHPATVLTLNAQLSILPFLPACQPHSRPSTSGLLFTVVGVNLQLGAANQVI
jgi:hypothetical protein